MRPGYSSKTSSQHDSSPLNTDGGVRSRGPYWGGSRTCHKGSLPLSRVSVPLPPCTGPIRRRTEPPTLSSRSPSIEGRLSLVNFTVQKSGVPSQNPLRGKVLTRRDRRRNGVGVSYLDPKLGVNELTHRDVFSELERFGVTGIDIYLSNSDCLF